MSEEIHYELIGLPHNENDAWYTCVLYSDEEYNPDWRDNVYWDPEWDRDESEDDVDEEDD